ncbi:MAG: 3-hydroxyacyl-CoA dehydrogenase NAD-binding domain-containing protein [Bacteroidales bacterium]|nr:3-hydroxyacyl-CoA dehydrogenase NAD-binding domain-containing protein [Bacteroidales bacterium]
MFNTANKIQLGVVGGGKMGRSIFQSFAKDMVPTVWYLRKDAESQKQKWNKIQNRLIESSLEKETDREWYEKNIIITDNINDLKNCAIIFESISENIEEKKKLLIDLQGIIEENTLIASNSSSYLPSELTKGIDINNKVVGLHYYYPVELHKFVELIVDGEKDLVEQLHDFLIEFDFVVYKQSEENAFWVNRLLLAFLARAFDLLLEGKVNAADLEEYVVEYINPSGVFKMCDTIGVDILITAITNYSNKIPTPSTKSILTILSQVKELEVKENKEGSWLVDVLVKKYNSNDNVIASKELKSELDEALHKQIKALEANKIASSEQIYFALVDILGFYYIPGI